MYEQSDTAFELCSGDGRTRFTQSVNNGCVLVMSELHVVCLGVNDLV